jgi:hypothetical protein
LGIACALALGAAGASAQELDMAALEAPEPSLAIEYGRSPTQWGFAIDIRGGAPFGSARLALSADGGPECAALVALDERGAARIVRRNDRFDREVRVSCTLAAADGSRAERSATIDPASAAPSASTLAAPGQVVICEIMKDPANVADSAGEWFEIMNRTNQPIDLEGWTITDAGTNSHTIHGTNGVWLPPRSYFVLGINADPLLNGGIQVGYRYSSFTLANGADEIRLTDATGVLVDVVAYDDGIFWPDEPGKSLTLSRALIDAGLNDDGANWCSALYPVSSANADFGTPRVANNNCP